MPSRVRETKTPVRPTALGADTSAWSSPSVPVRRKLPACLALLACVTARAQDDPSRTLFRPGTVLELRIELDEAAVASLRTNPRSHVRATLHDGRTAHRDVGVKLKGAAGSFREFDDRPAFSISLDKFDSPTDFHGLRKFHLNNSVQDGTLLHEWLGSGLAGAAGVPATRVAHARVRVNERDLGMYVLKEGFDERFLQRHFGSRDAILFDGGFCQDIDADLELDEGDEATARERLAALREACAIADPAARARRLAELVDVDAFVTFVALELMLGHWDGYAMNRNNYRLVFPPEGGARFLPHGMDQLFGDAEASILSMPPAIVARALLRLPDVRKKYRKRVTELLPLFAPAKLGPRIAEVVAGLRPAMARLGDEAATAHRDAVTDLEARLAARWRSLREQAAAPDPKPVATEPGRLVAVKGWHPAPESEEAQLEETRIEGVRALLLASRTGNPVTASWRTTVLLAPGRHRFVATVRTDSVVGAEGDADAGVTVRVSGQAAERRIQGTARWDRIEFEFEVQNEPDDIELVVELRNASGRAWVQQDSLRVGRLKP